MGNISLESFDKEAKGIIKANAKKLQERIEKGLPVEASKKVLKNLSLEVAAVAYMKYESGYVSYEELCGEPKLIYVKQEGYQWTNRKGEDEQKVIVEYNDCVAMLYDVEDECIANTQAVTDWTDEPRILVYSETF